MSSPFFRRHDAERILDIAENNVSLDELEKRLEQLYPRRVRVIVQAIKHFYVLARPEIDRSIVDSWREFTGGFVRLSDEKKLIDEFCSRFGVDKSSFLGWYLGRPVLKRRFEFETEDFLFYLNYLVLRKILRKGKLVIAKFDAESFGYAIKRLLYLAKNMYDLFINSQDRTVTIVTKETPPIRFAWVLLKSARLRVCYRKKCIDLEPPQETQNITFDSAIEEALYRAFISSGLKVRREPVIVLGDLVFIPDFEVCNKKCGLVEVVGYWRKWYLINKEIKIRRYLKNYDKPLILVISSKLEGNFRHIKTYKFHYKNKNDLFSIAKKIGDILS